jgi:hypothetical protein
MAQQQQQQLMQMQMQMQLQLPLQIAALLLTQPALGGWTRLQWQQRERACKHAKAKAAAVESAAVKQGPGPKQPRKQLKRRGESLRALSLLTS